MSEFTEHMKEVMAFNREQMDRASQHGEELKTRITNFIDSLDADDLLTLRDIVTNSTNECVGHEIEGIITGCLVYKHRRSWSGETSPLEGMTASASIEKQVASQEEERAANMVRYGLIPEGDYFACANCGQFYISLEDRMLREPGVKGCKGCQEKAKFG